MKGGCHTGADFLSALFGLEDRVGRHDQRGFVSLGERSLEELAVDLGHVAVLDPDALDAVDVAHVVAGECLADGLLGRSLLGLKRLHRGLGLVELDDERLERGVQVCDALCASGRRGGCDGCHDVLPVVGVRAIIRSQVFSVLVVVERLALDIEKCGFHVDNEVFSRLTLTRLHERRERVLSERDGDADMSSPVDNGDFRCGASLVDVVVE